jgi:AcrR family transcriptional regulator
MEKDARERSRRDEYTEATRAALLAAGRDIFTREGFQAAGIEAISRAARVTRGAFYHHFLDKKALFDAVVVALQAEAAAKTEAAAGARERIWDRLRTGIDAYLDASSDPAYRRLVVQEAPAVLGEARSRAIEEAYPLALLTASLNALKRRGELACDDIDLLGRLVDAMICKLMVLLPEAEDPKDMRARGLKIIMSLLDGHRPV